MKFCLMIIFMVCDYSLEPQSDMEESLMNFAFKEEIQNGHFYA